MRVTRNALLCGALLGSCAGAAQAEVNIVFHPVVEYREIEAEARGFVTRDTDPSKRGDRIIKADVAYGVTPWWWTELEFVWDKEPGGPNELEAIASENVFQLSEQGEYFADFGLFAEYEREVHESVNEVVLAPIVEKQFGPVQATANVFFEYAWGADVSDSTVETSWAGQLRLRHDPRFEPGFEYYGDDETGNVGPGIFGTLPLGGTDKLKYELVALFGTNDDSADQTYRWLLEYEFR